MATEIQPCPVCATPCTLEGDPEGTRHYRPVVDAVAAMPDPTGPARAIDPCPTCGHIPFNSQSYAEALDRLAAAEAALSAEREQRADKAIENAIDAMVHGCPKPEHHCLPWDEFVARGGLDCPFCLKARVGVLEGALREIENPAPRAYQAWCDQQFIPPTRRDSKDARVRYAQSVAQAALSGQEATGG